MSRACSGGSSGRRCVPLKQQLPQQRLGVQVPARLLRSSSCRLGRPSHRVHPLLLPPRLRLLSVHLQLQFRPKVLVRSLQLQAGQLALSLQLRPCCRVRAPGQALLLWQPLTALQVRLLPRLLALALAVVPPLCSRARPRCARRALCLCCLRWPQGARRPALQSGPASEDISSRCVCRGYRIYDFTALPCLRHYRVLQVHAHRVFSTVTVFEA